MRYFICVLSHSGTPKATTFSSFFLKFYLVSGNTLTAAARRSLPKKNLGSSLKNLEPSLCWNFLFFSVGCENPRMKTSPLFHAYIIP